MVQAKVAGGLRQIDSRRFCFGRIGSEANLQKKIALYLDGAPLIKMKELLSAVSICIVHWGGHWCRRRGVFVCRVVFLPET